MMKIISRVSLFLALCLFSYSSFALDAPTNLRVSDSANGEVSIDWQAVPGAIGYYYYIGNESWQYTDGIDLIDDTQYTISDISEEKVYYIAITSVDEFWSESAYSNEISYSGLTGTPINGNWFRVSEVEIIDEFSMYIKFSRSLDPSDTSPKDFIIEEKNTWLEALYTLARVDTDDTSKVIVIFDSELKPETEYEITVLDVRDSDGNNIESGIDAFLSFTTSNFSPETVKEDETFDLESASWDIVSTTENTQTRDNALSWSIIPSTEITQAGENTLPNSEENNSSSVPFTKSSSNNAGNAGVTVTWDVNDDAMNQVATETEKLPSTWSEHILLALLAMLLSTWVFYKVRNK